MNSTNTNVSVNFYGADGTLDYQDSWSTEAEAREAILNATNPPQGSFAVVLDASLNEIYRHTYA